MDLGIIGNVRPDWFMDKIGGGCDVQYLGDQHIYYEGVPRLVKQWRKQVRHPGETSPWGEGHGREVHVRRMVPLFGCQFSSTNDLISNTLY